MYSPCEPSVGHSPVFWKSIEKQYFLGPVVDTIKTAVWFLQPGQPDPGNDLADIAQDGLLVHFVIPFEPFGFDSSVVEVLQKRDKRRLYHT